MDESGLDRFVSAQAGIYKRALAELKIGRKESHWMWFVFPQIAGLGRSETSRRYAIGSIGEARAYLALPLLGARLRECVEALNAIEEKSAEAILGPIDAAKLRSSLTLFLRAGGGDAFARCLRHYFEGEQDEATLRLLD